MFSIKIAKLKSKNIFWTIIAFLLFSPVGVVLAAGGESGPNQLKNPLRKDINSIETFLKMLLEAVVTIATPIIVLMIVYSGFLFIKAQGKPEELITARKAVMWTIIGAIIVLGAAVLSEAIKGTVDDLQAQSFYSVELV